MNNLLSYNEFKSILNAKLFEDSFSDLLTKIAENPDRYIGLFRPTKPKTKLIQNITQSHEIKYGVALESIFERYFEALGFQNLPKRFTNQQGKIYDIDQLFTNGITIFMIEQKVRDDHDSTKKFGQFSNFESKYFELTQIYPNRTIVPIMWFIDDSLQKNRNYYIGEMNRMADDYKCTCHLFYGDRLFGANNGGIEELDIAMWNEVIEYLEFWKNTLPDMPEVNFDLRAPEVFEEIKDLPPVVYRKLLNNNNIVEQIFPIIFPEHTVLHLLFEFFGTKCSPVYSSLKNKIEDYLLSTESIAADKRIAYCK